MKRLLVTSLLLLLGCTPKPQASSEHGDIVFTPCILQGAGNPANCATLSVPRDHAKPEGEQLTLRVVRIDARGSTPRADPLFLLAGGPGQAASEAFTSMLPAFGEVARDRDIVMVDQRGTGTSTPLDCDIPMDLPAMFRSTTLAEVATRCANKLNHNPAHFSTQQAADDLDVVRRKLGYDRINLLGVSYGTRLAMRYAVRHPEAARTLVLDSVAPTELRIPASFAADAQEALNHVVALCNARPSCADAYPDLGQLLPRVLANLKDKPVTLETRHPATDVIATITIDHQVFGDGVRSLLYASELVSLLPFSLQQASVGNFRPFVAQLSLLGGSADQASTGLTLSILCNEDIPFVDKAAMGKANAGTFVGDSFSAGLMQACEHWPRATMPLAAADWRADTPTLALSGSSDPVTPPRWAEVALKHLPNSSHVVLPNAGHSIATRGCIPELVAQFLEQPEKPVDGSCVADFKPPPFFVDAAGPNAQSRDGGASSVWLSESGRAMIEARGLRKTFGEVVAVDDLSFVAKDGGITGLLGHNGAGKTTALRMLYSLLRPDAGEALVDGIDVNKQPQQARHRLGVLADARGLYGRLTAHENIRYFGELYGLDGPALDRRVDELIALLDLTRVAHRQVAGFSQGERMKVAIGRAMVHAPNNLILDEPTNGLDVMSTRALRKLLLSLRDEGQCIVLSSHIMQEVSALCDHIVIVADGRVVARGTAESLKEQTGIDSLEDLFVQLTINEREADSP